MFINVLHLDSGIQSLIETFKSRYKNENKYLTDEKWSPYQCKSFIKLAFVVHKNPKIKKQDEVDSIATMQLGGNISCGSEIVFSDVTTQTELRSIFGNSTSDNLKSSVEITLIEGTPGIGKTVVVQEIAYQWASNEILSHIELLLLIYLNQIDTHIITNFEELMHHCYPDDKDIASSCAKYFTSTQGKNLMIIFDGYDEMTTADQGKTDNFFMKLLQRETLPDCCLVVTSRPYITAHLHQYCDCRVEIMGFTKDDRHEYFEKHLPSEKLNTVTDFLEKHLIIDSLCYIPLNLVSFLSLVEYDISLPKTQTELTSYTVHLTVARNISKEGNYVNTNKKAMFEDRQISKIITDIASFAYRMLDKEQLVFSETDMKSIGFHVEGKHENYGLLKAVQINDIENKRHKKFYSFVHFSVQEYLAAYHLSKTFNITQNFALNHKFWDVKYFGVWRMYTGLTKGNNFPLQIFLSKEWLLTGSLRYLFGFKFPGIADELKMNKVTCLQLFQIFLEAPDSEIQESLSTIVRNDTINLSGEKLSHTDMNMLSYFVARSYITKEWQIINLCNCNIDDHRLKTFYQGLCIEDGREKTLIKFLDISQNMIGELNTLIELVTKCKDIIHLKASRILCTNACNATNNVEYYNKTLKILNLSGNHLSSNDVCTLCKALAKCKSLEILDLSNNNLDDDSIGPLIEAVVQWDTLKELKYEQNNFSDSNYISSLLEFTITHLRCNGNSLCFKGDVRKIDHFITILGYAKNVSTRDSNYINFISQLRELSMDCVDYDHSSLSDAKLAMKNVSRVNNLHMDSLAILPRLELTVTGSEGFQIFSHLVSLNISGVIISELSSYYLVKAFSNNLQLEKLILNKCQITSTSINLLCQQLKFISLKVFEIMENSIDDKAIEELAITTLHWDLLESIKLQKNNLSIQCMLLLKMLTEDVESLSIIDFANSYYAVKALIEVLDYTSNHTGERVTQFLNNLSKVTKLSLEVQTHLEMTLNASNTLNKEIRNIVSLNISGIIITEEVADNLCSFFDNNQKSLKYLIMNDCQLNSIKISKFVHKLKLTAEISEAEFCNNEIDDDVTESLIIAFLNWNVIKTLEFKNNRFKDRNMKIFKMIKEFSKFHNKCINFNGNIDKINAFINLLGYMTNVEVNNCVIVKNVSQVQKLLLDCSGQYNTNVQFEFNASKFLTRFVRLIELNISGIEVTNELSGDLAIALSSNLCCLKHLIMNNCKLTSTTSCSVIGQLQNCLKLTELKLSNNNIDNTAMKVIVVAIFHWEYFEVFEFKGNHFSPDNESLFEFLISHLKFSSSSLNLSGSWLHLSSFITLLGYMKEVPTNKSRYVRNISEVKTLNLNCADQQSTDAPLKLTVTSSESFQIFNHLVSLNISGIIINDSVVECLVKAFENNLQLKELFMNKCQITTHIIKVFCQQLQHISLKVFEIMENSVDDKAMEELAITTLHWSLLESIKLQKNNLSTQCMLLLKMLTEDVESLSIIDFANSYYAVKALIEVLDYTSNHTGERVTQFLNNLSKVTKLSLKVQTHLEMTLNASNNLNKEIRSMVSLNISGIIITEEVADNLCSFFDNNQKSLKYLIMNDCQLNSIKISKFVHKLKLTAEINEAEFCNNEIDDDVTESLVIAFLHWNVIKTLEFKNNRFKDRNMKIFKMIKEFSKFHNKCINFNGNIDKINTFISLLGYMTNAEVNNCIIVKNVSQVEKLLLDCSEQSNTNVQFKFNASKFLTRFVHLIELNISGIEVTNELSGVLAIALSSNLCSLEHLIMNNCKLTSTTSCSVIRQLQNCLKLTELELSNNNIDDTAMKVIVVAIFHWEYFEVFEFKGNHFSVDNELLFEFLISHLKFSSSSLNLSGSWLHLSSFITLLGYMKGVSTNKSKYVRNISKVKTLNLNCANQQSTGASIKLTVTSSEGFQIFNHLVSLNISGIIINDSVVECLVKAFENNLQLKELFINKCQITTHIMKVFCQQLQHISLKIFEIMENSIDDKAIEELAITTLHWGLLESIKLQKNNLSIQCMLLLKMLTEDVESLSIIDFANSYYAVKALIEVLDYTSNHTGERVTQFLNNLSKVTKLSLEVQTHLEMTLNASNTLNKEIKSMVSLNISGIIITEEVADNLCSFFDNNQKSLKYLIMNDCQLNSIKISKFVHKLKLTAGINEAEFCNNEIDDDVTESLVIAFLHWNVIKTLEFKNNRFKDRSMKIIKMIKEFSKFHDTCINFNGNIDKTNTFISLLGYMTNAEVNNCVIVKNVSQVEKLLLDCSEQSNTNVQFEFNASKFLTRFVHLIELNISGIEVTNELSGDLAIALSSNLCSLKHLIMNNCKLTSTTSCNVIGQLQNCLKLTELKLSNNNIDDTAVKVIVVAIFHWEYFELFEFKGNQFSQETESLFDFLLSHLKFSNSSLNLSSNFHQMKSFITLLCYMKEVPTNKSKYVGNIFKVKTLNLNCLDQQSTGAMLELKLTSSGGFQIFNQLVSLNISGIIINDSVDKCLVKTFENNLQLKELFMNKCQITTHIMKVFCQQLQCISLKVFEVMENCIDDKAIEELAITILHWDSLESIKLIKNNLSTQCMLLLKMLTEDMESLSIIDFANGYYAVKTLIEVLGYASDHTGERITQFLNNFMHITKLSLQVQTPLEMTLQASNTLKKASSMNSLNLSGIIITEQVAANLCEFFNNNQKPLKHLVMNDCKLDSNKLLKFVHKLKSTTQIVEAQFCHNKIDDNATNPLVIAILHWNAFQVLELEKNCFTQNSIRKFEVLKMLSKLSTVSLDFSGKMSKIVPFITILGYMIEFDIKDSVLVENVSKVNKLLLDCSEQSNTNVQFEVRASKFFARFFNLTELNVSGMAISKEVADNLANTFDSNLHSLEHLIMNNCQLTSPMVANLIIKIPNCVGMRELQLCNNFLNDEIAGTLIISILHLNELQQLKLEQNSFNKRFEKVFHFLTNYLRFCDSVIFFNDDMDSIIAFITLLEYMQSISVNVSNFVDNVSKVGSLSLDCSKLNTSVEKLELTTKASQFFQRFQLIKLNLCGITIKEAVIDNILQAFGADLQSLCMNNCDLNSKTVIKLMQKLQTAKNIEEFQLCNNHIGDEATESIVKVILHWNSFKCIKLEGNNFTEKDTELLKFLNEFLKFSSRSVSFGSTIEKLIPFIAILGYMMEVDINASVLVENVSKVNKLLLDCSQQSNTNVQFEVRASKFFTRFINLTELNVSGILISKDVADNLASAFDGNLHSLEHLIMNNCQLTSPIAANLIRKLPSCVGMRELQLCNNFLNDKIAETLIISILHLNELFTLKVTKNNFSSKYVMVLFLTKYLKYSTSVINFNNCLDRIKAFITLLECMEGISGAESNFVDNISKVKSLSLGCSKKSAVDEELELTAKASQFFQRLELINLNLSGIIIKPVVTDNILQALGVRLQSLFMNHCNLNSETVVKLMQALKSSRNIKEVELCNNDIGDEAIEAITIGILHWDFVEVKLEDTKLSKQCNLLLKLFTNDFQPESINFRNNYHAITSFINVLNYLNNGKKSLQFRENVLKTTILNLSIECYHQHPVSMSIQATCFFQQFKNLRVMNISGIIIDQQAADKLSKAFSSNLYSLEFLVMNKCRLTSKIFRNFVIQLKDSASIKDLQWCDNNVGDEATESTAIAIISCNSLKSIKYGNNDFSPNCTLLLKLLIERNTSATVIDFSSDYYSTKSLISILSCTGKYNSNNTKCFKGNISETTKLSLDCSQVKDKVQISYESVTMIKDFICLRELNVSAINIDEGKTDAFVSLFNSDIWNLQCLCMNNCQINSITATKIVQALQNKKMKKLQLCDNLIDDDASETLAMAILQWESPEVKLERNRFTKNCQMQLDLITKKTFIFDCNTTLKVDGDVKLFLTILHRISNKNSYFKDNAAGIISLSLSTSAKGKLLLSKNSSEAFKYFKKVSKLEISGIIINKQAARIISQIVANNHLEAFKLKYCQLDSKSAVKLLSTDSETMPVSFETLKFIDFSCNCIEDDALQPLFNSFLQIPKLQRLNLQDNKFTDVQPMISILFNCKNCKHEINYSDRPDSRRCIFSFFNLLSFIKEDTTTERSCYIKNLTGINYLILEHYHEDPLILNEDGAKFFQRFNSLTELNLSGIHIHQKSTEYLSYTLQRCTSLLTLKLKHCQLNSDSVKMLFSSANSDIDFLIKLKYLELTNNNIDDEATDVLIKLLIQIPVNAVLYITGNSFSNNNRKALYSALSEFACYNSSIIYSECDAIETFLILLGGINKLAKSRSKQIENITTIEKLNLHCRVVTVDLNDDASLFFQRFHRLTELQITGICFKINVVNNLANALHRNLSHTLQLLKISQCKLNSKFIMSLFHKVSNEIMFHKLLAFDISNNDIDDDAACVLITLWLQMPELVELNIDGNYFSEEFFITIEFMLAFNRNYTDVIDSTNPTICQYRSVSNNYTQENGRSYYGRIHYPHQHRYLNFYYYYKRTTKRYKESAYAAAFIKLLECARNISIKNSNQVGNIFELEKVFLNFKQSRRSSKNILVFPMLFFNIKELNLSGISIDIKAASVTKFHFLQKVTLNKCYLSSTDVKNILLLLNKSVLTSLCLTQNQITFEAADTLKEFVENNGVLMDLDLSYNNFKDEGAAAVVQSLHTCSQLKRLNFSHNEITDNLTQKLVTSLLKLHSYIEIGIDGNDFSKPTDIKTVFDLIVNYRKSQEVVEYDNSTLDYVNPFITLLGGLQKSSKEAFRQSDNIAAANSVCLKNVQHNTLCELTIEASLFFKKFNKLKELKLSGILITPAAINILAEAIASNLYLVQVLELNGCHLNSDSAIAIVSVLNKRQISFLYLSHNQIDSKAASTIQRFIENNNTLKTFNLAYNSIGTEGIKIISQCLVSCKRLQSLNISYNNITDEGTVFMISSIIQMPWLTELVSNGNHNHVTEIFNIATELKNTKYSIEYHNGNATTFLELLDYVKDVPIENSPQLKNISKIRNLHLINSHSYVSLKETVFIFLNQCTKLETLSIDGITISLEAADIIANALYENFNNLQNLKLRNCKLDSKVIVRLFLSNKECVPVAYKVLRNIDLEHNSICDEAVIPLVTSLLQMHKLERLHLDNNHFQEHNIKSLFQLVLEFKVTKQYFKSTDDPWSVASFLTLLSSANNVSLRVSQQVYNLMKLRELELEYTGVSKLCLLTFECANFFAKFLSLTSLNLYGIKIQPEAITVIAEALDSHLPLLEGLKLSTCAINSESAIKIISSLNKVKIKILLLSGNLIDYKAVKVLCDFVGNNNILTEINLSHNNLATKGALSLIEGLVSCENLVKYDLSHNNITDDATESLVKLIKQVVK